MPFKNDRITIECNKARAILKNKESKLYIDTNFKTPIYIIICDDKITAISKRQCNKQFVKSVLRNEKEEINIKEYYDTICKIINNIESNLGTYKIQASNHNYTKTGYKIRTKGYILINTKTKYINDYM